MAINRAPFNALVDDDGSGLTGSIWNKDKIKTVILDPADAAFAWTTVLSNIASGTYHNFHPGIVGSTILELQGAAPGVNITGFLSTQPPFTGQQLIVANSGPSSITFVHEDAGSLPGAQLRLPAALLPIAGYWASAMFTYCVFPSNGIGYWMLTANRNGHGAFADVGVEG
jgi:hypothetical protein